MQILVLRFPAVAQRQMIRCRPIIYRKKSSVLSSAIPEIRKNGRRKEKQQLTIIFQIDSAFAGVIRLFLSFTLEVEGGVSGDVFADHIEFQIDAIARLQGMEIGIFPGIGNDGY